MRQSWPRRRNRTSPQREYAICKQMTPVPLDGSPYVECWGKPIYITEGEAALIIAHRADWEGLPVQVCAHDRARIARLKKQGLWPPEVTA